MQDLLEKATKGIDNMPKCDNCGSHLMGGALTFTNIHEVQVTWCMKCVLGAVNIYEKTKEQRMRLE